MTQETLKPRDFGDQFSQTFSLMWRCLGKLIGVQAVCWLPVLAFAALLGMLAFGYFEQRPDFDIEEITSEEWVTIGIVGGIVALVFLALVFVVQPVVNMASVLVVADRFVGPPMSVLRAYAVAFSRVIPLFVFALIWTGVALLFYAPFIAVVAVAAAADAPLLFLLLIPLFPVAIAGIVWFGTVFGITPVVIVIEQRGVFDAMQRARDLTRGSRWRILGLFVVFVILAALMGMVIGFPLGILQAVAPGNIAVLLISQFGSQFLSTAIQGAVVGAISTVIYFDLRVRRDGYDLDSMADLVDVVAEREGEHFAPGDAPSGLTGSAADFGRIDPE